jgi:hypothetical protein
MKKPPFESTRIPQSVVLHSFPQFVARHLLFVAMSFAFMLPPEFAQAELDLLRPRSLHRVNVDPRTGAGQTYFELAQSSYRRGISFNPKTLAGVYVGRCYYADSPMKAVASLVVVTKDDAAVHGPGTQDYSRIVPLVDRDSAADRFDSLKAQDLATIKGLAMGFSDELALPVESRRETLVVGLRTPEEDSRLYRFRRVKNDSRGEELHLRLECAEDQVCLSANSSLGRHTVLAFEGQAIAHCRYFKRVRPRN